MFVYSSVVTIVLFQLGTWMVVRFGVGRRLKMEYRISPFLTVQFCCEPKPPLDNIVSLFLKKYQLVSLEGPSTGLLTQHSRDWDFPSLRHTHSPSAQDLFLDPFLLVSFSLTLRDGCGYVHWKGISKEDKDSFPSSLMNLDVLSQLTGLLQSRQTKCLDWCLTLKWQ